MTTNPTLLEGEDALFEAINQIVEGEHGHFINKLKPQIVAAISAHVSTKEREARIDEVKTINLRRYNADPTSSFALPLGNYIEKRIEELNAKEKDV